MVGALVKRDNIKGLCERFDALVDEYPDTFDMIAEAAKYSVGPVSASSAGFLSVCQQCAQTALIAMQSQTPCTSCWPVHFYGDIVGFEGESELRSDQPCRRRVSKGDELNKAAPAPPAPPPAPAAPAPAVGENGVRPTDEPRTPPAGEGAEAGAGDPAPGESSVPCPATPKPGHRRGEK